MENTETQVWLDFALKFNYLSKAANDALITLSEEVGKLLHHMEENPARYSAVAK